MNTPFQIEAIGQIEQDQSRKFIRVFDQYLRGLTGIEDFSHLQIVWWGHLADAPEKRRNLIINRIFRKAPDRMGIFSTRAPARPNPILLTTIKVNDIDLKEGTIFPQFIDAEPGSPVLDIKPYYHMDRVRDCQVPRWCAHWPQWAEDTAGYDWSEEMNL